MSKQFTLADISAHKTEGDLYFAIHSAVYDVSKFASQHPGGSDIFFDVAGRDATEAFEDVGHSDEARAMLPEFKVGELEKQEETPTLATKQRDDAATASRTELFVRLGLMVVVALGAGMFLQPWKSNQDM